MEYFLLFLVLIAFILCVVFGIRDVYKRKKSRKLKLELALNQFVCIFYRNFDSFDFRGYGVFKYDDKLKQYYLEFKDKSCYYFESIDRIISIFKVEYDS